MHGTNHQRWTSVVWLLYSLLDMQVVASRDAAMQAAMKMGIRYVEYFT
ncbi:hypothetical protein [Stenotrophomonas phage CM2]